MAHFLFNTYMKSATKCSDIFSSAPISESSKVGIALINNSDGLDADSTVDNIMSVLSDNGAEKATKAMTDIEIETNTSGDTLLGSALEIHVKSKAVSFGTNPNDTTISAMGAVVYVKKSGNVHEYVDTDFNSDSANTVPVCFLDFGDAVSASSGPFKVIFNGGSGSGEDEIAGTVFKYKQSSV